MPILFGLTWVVAPPASQAAGLLRALAECSPAYFAQLAGSADFASVGYRFTKQGRLVVPNHRDELDAGSRAMGKSAVMLDGFKVIGLYDLHRKANTFEALDWGVLVEGDSKEVVHRLNAQLPPQWQLEPSADPVYDFAFARLEKTSMGSWPQWTTVRPLPRPAPPAFGDVEMVMEVTLESDKLPGVSRVGCSMQGVFPPFVVKSRRPDIE